MECFTFMQANGKTTLVEENDVTSTRKQVVALKSEDKVASAESRKS